MDVVSLLKSKNRCLKRFLDLSVDYLALAEKGDFSTLQDFQDRREATIRALGLYDRKISEVVASLRPAQRDETLVSAVKQELEARDRLVHDIVKVDHCIIGRIEEEKARLARELASAEKSKAMVRKFKSGWVQESGEELDKKL